MYQICQLLFFVAIFVTIFWSPCRKDGQLWILPRQQCKLIIFQINGARYYYCSYFNLAIFIVCFLNQPRWLSVPGLLLLRESLASSSSTGMFTMDRLVISSITRKKLCVFKIICEYCQSFKLIIHKEKDIKITLSGNPAGIL